MIFVNAKVENLSIRKDEEIERVILICIHVTPKIYAL